MHHRSTIVMHPNCDPQKVIHYALTSDDLNKHAPRQILMSWIMDLPQNLDTANAAKTLIETYSDHPEFVQGEAQKELLTLLYEVSIADPEKQKRGHASKKRNRRWR
ncbi:MAG: hypothetical protein AAF420_00365 [Pseudomonadota bacterium]